jgi:hypothetical protein
VQDDDDAMNFVTAAANLRALNYTIPMQSRFEIKCMRSMALRNMMSFIRVLVFMGLC